MLTMSGRQGSCSSVVCLLTDPDLASVLRKQLPADDHQVVVSAMSNQNQKSVSLRSNPWEIMFCFMAVAVIG